MPPLVENYVVSILSQGATLEPWDLWDEDADEYMFPVERADLSSRQSGSVKSEQGALFSNQSGEMVSLREAERQMIMQALHKTDNNRTHAAKMLGISVRTLRNKLNEYRNKGFSV